MARQGKSTNDEVSFADVMLEKRCRKAQNVFLNQVDGCSVLELVDNFGS